MSAIACHSSAGNSGAIGRVALGQQRLVLDAADPLAARALRIVDVDHQQLAGRPAAPPRASTGANSVSVSSALASPCCRMNARAAGVEAGVQRVEDGAAHRHAVMRLQHRRNVGQHRRHRVAGPDAAPLQGRGQPQRALEQLAVGAALAAMHHGDAVGIDGGGAHQERQRRQRRVVGARCGPGPRRRDRGSDARSSASSLIVRPSPRTGRRALARRRLRRQGRLRLTAASAAWLQCASVTGSLRQPSLPACGPAAGHLRDLLPMTHGRLRRHLAPTILAGGSGTRLWPVSRAAFPKHLVELFGEESLLQTTVRRALGVAPAGTGDHGGRRRPGGADPAPVPGDRSGGCRTISCSSRRPATRPPPWRWPRCTPRPRSGPRRSCGSARPTI